MRERRNSDDELYEIGERFGSNIAMLVRTLRAYAVTVSRIDEENNRAFVTFFSDEAEFPVDLSLLGFGMMSATPNVGSMAVISFLNGDETTPFFIAFEAADKVIFKRGKTEIKWSITPPKRDAEGNEIAGETNDEVVMKIDTSTLRMVKDLIELNGGSLGDLVVIGKLTERLNKLKNEFDTFVQKYNSHTHPFAYNGGPTPATGVTQASTASAQTASQFKDSDYNNEKIKQ